MDVSNYNTVNSSMFARDLFGEFRDHLQIAKINTPQTSLNIIHVPRQLARPKLTANINPHKHDFVSKMQTLIIVNPREHYMNLQ